MARWEKQQLTCPECNRLREVCSDHERTFYPHRSVCYASMETEAAQAAYDALHEKRPWHDGTFASWSEKRDAGHPYHYTHGVRIGVAETDLAPWDAFTTVEHASPVKPTTTDEEAVI